MPLTCPATFFGLTLNNRRMLVQTGSYLASEMGIDINAKVSLSEPGQIPLQTRSPRAFLDWLSPQLPQKTS